jgi:hypothetical protein
MDLDDHVAYRWLRLGPLGQPHPGGARCLVRHDDRLHEIASTVICLFGGNGAGGESPFDM